MIYAFLCGSGLLLIEADDEETAIETLVDNRLVPSIDAVGAGMLTMGKVIRVRGKALDVTGEEELMATVGTHLIPLAAARRTDP